MGRLIDVDRLINKLWGTGLTEKHLKIIEDMPTVEAIPKADYEAHLKSDMVAMLTKIQLEIEEKRIDGSFYGEAILDCAEVIQQKIKSLKEA